MTSSNTTLSIPDLRAAFPDRLIAPDSPEYDEARLVVRGDIDRRPAVIIRPGNTAEVARAVLLAAESGLELAVRCGGHSAMGHSVSDGGIVIDLKNMRAIEIDVERRTAWARTGLTAGDYTRATGAHGLVTGFGDTGSVGIGGITLGGGVGFLSRKYGLTIDSLLGAEIVTANGEVLDVDAESHPDLFWAIRGGGGNFGVATRFKYRLQKLSTVVGGILILPATAESITSFVELAEAAPDELSTIANVMVAPPMPFIPPEAHGKTILMVMLTYAGPPEAAEPVLAGLRAIAPPIADMLRPMSYPEMYPPEPEGYRPIAANRTMFFDSFGRGDAETILEHLAASTAMMRVTQLRVLGGAIARVPNDATAFAHRGRKIMANVAAIYQQLDETETHERWVSGLTAALSQGEPAAYVGFQSRDAEPDVRAIYPGPTWDRLAAVKRRYDPGNLFRLNHNVPPAADGT